MANQDKIREAFGIHSSLKPSDEFIAGVELEIEGCSDWNLGVGSLGTWHVTEDGSLREGGHEFISPPLQLEPILQGFKDIHQNKAVSWMNGIPKFSDRTSIHVHVNMLDCTEKETKSMLLWYAVFESVFFAMCEPKRRNNIHCVGLDQTVLSESYSRSLPYLAGKWHKYTALNVLPLKKLGTIEFRHMEGHDNFVLFEEWLQTLRNLWKLSKSMPLEKECVTDEELLRAFDAIFKDASIKNIRGSVLELCANNILDVKLSFI